MGLNILKPADSSHRVAIAARVNATEQSSQVPKVKQAADHREVSIHACSE